MLKNIVVIVILSAVITGILYMFYPDLFISRKPVAAATARLSNTATPLVATPITNLIITDEEGNMSNAKTIEVDDNSSISRIQTPNGNLKINNQGIMFGGKNKDKEINSCQIIAGVHDDNALCIVGMGTVGQKRKVKVWDNLEVTEYTKSNKYRIGDRWVLSGVGDAHGNDDWLRLFGSDEKGYHGGLAAGKLWSGGKIEAVGDISTGGRICIGGTCINENHLKILTGGTSVNLCNQSSGKGIDNYYNYSGYYANIIPHACRSGHGSHRWFLNA